MIKESDSIVQNRKYYQRNKMLNIIRFHKNVSRYDIKKMTSYSMTTVIGMIDELVSRGYVYEEECEENRVGRKPVWIKINPEGGFFIGIEFNGRMMHCDILDFSGSVIYRNETSMSREDSRDDILMKILNNINMAREQLGENKDKVLGVGIGVPGYINKEEGIAKGYTHFVDWKDVPIKKIIEEQIDVPCYIENNVDVMAFAYKWFYFNGACEDFLFLSIRTGARLVPVINNRLVFSETGFSGEIGHVKIVAKHDICTCGKFGCLNTEVSDFAIAARIREGIRIGRFREIKEMVNGDLEAITVTTFVKSVLLRHEDSLKLMKEIALHLGNALGFTVNLLAPKKIIIFGELAKIGSLFIDEVRKDIEDIVIPENIEGFSVQASNEGEDLGAIGAAALVMQKQFSFIEQTI
ncbi:MAG: ROK family transcriptional regulator [Lachnospiraceae bacterium]